MILKYLGKNLKHKIRFYQNLIVFSWNFVSFKKKNSGEFFEIIINFYFLLLWLILHKIAVKNLQRNLQIMSSNTELKKEKRKKEANFINNQLEFLFFFSSKTKYIYDFPKQKSQTSKNSKQITTFTKSTMSDYNIKTVSFRH